MRKSLLPLLLALGALIPAAASAAPGGGRAIANTLETRRVTAKLEKASLDQVVDFLRISSGLNIVVLKKTIEKEIGDPAGIEISLDVHDVRLADFFNLTLEPLGLALKVQGNVLLITTKKDARGKPVLVMYDIAEHLMPLRDFPAGDINIHPSNYEPPDVPEPEVVQAVASSDELAEMVRQFCGQGTWEDEGVRLTTFRRHLFVTQYPEVHVQIRRLLAAVAQLR